MEKSFDQNVLNMPVSEPANRQASDRRGRWRGCCGPLASIAGSSTVHSGATPRSSTTIAERASDGANGATLLRATGKRGKENSDWDLPPSHRRFEGYPPGYRRRHGTGLGTSRLKPCLRRSMTQRNRGDIEQQQPKAQPYCQDLPRFPHGRLPTTEEVSGKWRRENTATRGRASIPSCGDRNRSPPLTRRAGCLRIRCSLRSAFGPPTASFALRAARLRANAPCALRTISINSGEAGGGGLNAQTKFR